MTRTILTRIILGISILLVAGPVLADRTITVRKGDTLGGLAEKYLGSATRYRELARINKIPYPYYLRVGQKIRVPIDDNQSADLVKSVEQKILKFRVDYGGERTEAVYRYALRRLESIRQVKDSEQKSRELKNLGLIMDRISGEFSSSELLDNVKIVVKGVTEGAERVNPVTLKAEPLQPGGIIIPGDYLNAVKGTELFIGTEKIAGFAEPSAVSFGYFLKKGVGEVTGLIEPVRGGLELNATGDIARWFIFLEGHFLEARQAGIKVSRSGKTVTVRVGKGFLSLDNVHRFQAGDRFDIDESGSILRYPRTPIWTRPVDGWRTSEKEVIFGWMPTDPAARYLFELADKEGGDILIRQEIGKPFVRVVDLVEGEFKYRVAGLEGKEQSDFSAWREITIDFTPPGLELLSPEPGIELSGPDAEFSGRTEPSSILKINGTLVSADEQGMFSGNLSLSVGMNLVRFDITDRALNRAFYRGEFVYSENQSFVFNGDTLILTRNALLPVTGWMNEEEKVVIQGEPMVPDVSGYFDHRVLLERGENQLELRFEEKGRKIVKRYRLFRDDRPPVITYSRINYQPSPRRTESDTITIELRASDGDGVGLRESGSWSLAGVGDLSLKGDLFREGDNLYRALVQVPPVDDLKVLVGQIEVADILGNKVRREVRIVVD